MTQEKQVQFYRGTSEQIKNAPREEGALYLATDTGFVYTDIDGERVNLNNGGVPDTLPINRGGTNAEDVLGAISNLRIPSLMESELIPEGADLNSYTTPGVYTCDSSTVAKTIINAPYGDWAFRLTVFDQYFTVVKTNWVAQIAFINADPSIYFRIFVKTTNSWTEWEKIRTSKEIIDIAGGGTGSSTRKEAVQNLLFLGYNPTGGKANDTRAKWQEFGTGYAFISSLDQLNGQPYQYGFLINYVFGQEVHQEFWAQLNGAHYRRGANSDTTAMPSWVHIVEDGGAITRQIYKNVTGCSWIEGRSTAPFKTGGTVIANQYCPALSIKSQNGSWELGTYTNNDLYFTYVTDANVSAWKNTPTSQIKFLAGTSGGIAGNGANIRGIKAANISDLKSWLLTNIFKVGYVWISYTNTSPANILGGTWVAITGRFPYFNNGTGTGGSNRHTLSANEMPKHNHGAVRSDGSTCGFWNSNVGAGNGWAVLTGSNMADGALYDLYTDIRGGGAAHNNMPAYQTFYAWRRTA